MTCKRFTTPISACLAAAFCALVLPALRQTTAARDRLPHPIENAIGQGDAKEVQRLLEKQPELIRTRFDRSGDTLLHLAIYSDRKEILQALLDAHPDTSATNRQGVTPLHLAAEYGHTDLAVLLLANRARVNAHDDVGRTPLIAALLNGHLKLAIRLKENGGVFNPNWRDVHGDSLIKYLVQRPHAQVVQYVLKHDVELNARGRHGYAPIHVSLTKYIKPLANKGADLNAKGSTGETRLHWAATTGDMELTKVLLELGVDVNNVTPAGYTPLDLAAGHKETAKLLREHGAASAQAYLRAARNGDFKQVETFFKKYPQFAQVVGTLQHAVVRGDQKMAQLLVSHGVDVNSQSRAYAMTPLHQAAAHGSLEMVRWLVQHKAQVDPTDHHRQTPLHWSARGGHADVVKLLIENKAKINAATSDGETALHYAVRHAHGKAASLLIAGGAQVNVQDSRSGKSPLHHAAWNNDASMIKALVAAGAKVNPHDKLGWTPLDHALDGRRTEAIQLLRQNGAKSGREAKNPQGDERK